MTTDNAARVAEDFDGEGFYHCLLYIAGNHFNFNQLQPLPSRRQCSNPSYGGGTRPIDDKTTLKYRDRTFAFRSFKIGNLIQREHPQSVMTIAIAVI